MIYKRNLNLIFLILVLSCKSIKKDELKVVDFTTYFDVIFEKDKPNFVDRFEIKIIEFENSKLYIIPTHNTRISSELLDNGENKVRYDTTLSYLFVEKGKIQGLKFDSLNAVTGGKFKVDSLMDRINTGKKHLEDNSTINGNLVNSILDKKSGKVLMEKYYAKGEEFDSTFYYYDYTLKDIDFSIAPLLDQKYGSKLVKRLDIKSANIDQNGVKSTREEVGSEIRRGNYNKVAEIVKLFEIFKSESRRLNLN